MWVGAPASPYSVLQVKIQGDKRRLHGQTSIIAERQRVQECYSVKTRFELWITEVIELEQRQTNGKSRETCNQKKGTKDISIILKFLKDRNLVCHGSSLTSVCLDLYHGSLYPMTCRYLLPHVS